MPDCLDLGHHELLRPADHIYRWVADQYVLDGRIIYAHWPTKHWKNGLSCDWGILSGANQTAKRLAGTLPAYVLRFSIQDCLELGIRIHHCPVIDEAGPGRNLAHCLLFPPDLGPSAIRQTRSDLQERGTLLLVQPRFTHTICAFLRRWHPRYRAAIRHIQNSI